MIESQAIDDLYRRRITCAPPLIRDRLLSQFSSLKKLTYRNERYAFLSIFPPFRRRNLLKNNERFDHPFPFLMTTEKRHSVLLEFPAGTRNPALIECKFKVSPGEYIIRMGPDCSLFFKDCTYEAMLGEPIQYVDLLFAVSFGSRINKWNFVEFIEDTVVQCAMKEWR